MHSIPQGLVRPGSVVTVKNVAHGALFSPKLPYEILSDIFFCSRCKQLEKFEEEKYQFKKLVLIHEVTMHYFFFFNNKDKSEWNLLLYYPSMYIIVILKRYFQIVMDSPLSCRPCEMCVTKIMHTHGWTTFFS